METSVIFDVEAHGPGFASMPAAGHRVRTRKALAGRCSASSQSQDLTFKERDALTWTAAGKTAAEVAIIMGVSPKTVKKNVSSAMSKLGCTRKIQAVTKALRMGLLIDADSRLRLDSKHVCDLTDKELALLRWADVGKSAWETGMILQFSEQTATYHLEAATRKLGCVNKVHAVAAAIKLGLIQ